MPDADEAEEIRNDIQNVVSLDTAHIAEVVTVLKLTILGSDLFGFHQSCQGYRISLESGPKRFGIPKGIPEDFLNQKKRFKSIAYKFSSDYPGPWPCDL